MASPRPSRLRLLVATWHMLQLVWRAHPLFCAGIMLLTAVQGLFPLATAWVTKFLFDLLAQQMAGETAVVWSSLVGLLIAYAILAVLEQMVTPTHTYLNAELKRHLTVNIQSTIYSKINDLKGLTYFENPQFYDTIHLAERNARSAASNTLQVLLSLVQNVTTLVSFLGVLFAFEPLLVGLVMVGNLPQFYAHLKLGRQRFRLTRSLSFQERLSFFYSYLLSSREAAKEVRLFNLGAYFLQKLLRTYEEKHEAERRQQKQEMGWQLGLGGAASLVATVAFVLAVMAAFSGRLSLGDVTLYVSAVTTVQRGLAGLITAVTGLNENSLFYTYFTNLLALPHSLPIARNPQPVPPLVSGIELRQVSFRYSPQHPWVLQDINLFIPAGQCWAVVGLNGAGKTTLVKLLTRLYDPTEGQILWDGVDIRDFDPDDLRRHLGVIFQDFMRYDLTVQENIGLGNLAQVDDLTRVQTAAKKTGIHPDLAKLPQGYQTQLGFRFSGSGSGFDLSGGQWQKVATARVLMRQADLLILDEPTSALDAQAEHETYQQVASLVAGHTTVLISHRFSTVRMADCIVVLEEGRVLECGCHEALLRHNGRYAHLFTLQAQNYQLTST